MGKKIVIAVAVMVSVALVCIIGATIDSCKRNNLKCFGTSTEW